MQELAFKIKADFLRVLVHPVRLRIIDLLTPPKATFGKICMISFCAVYLDDGSFLMQI